MSPTYRTGIVARVPEIDKAQRPGARPEVDAAGCRTGGYFAAAMTSRAVASATSRASSGSTQA
jgi:hypothetical protein